MTKTEFEFGERIKADLTITDPDTGALVDPTSLSFIFKDPTGTVTTWVYNTDPEPIRLSLGKFRAFIDGDIAGEWKLRYASTGNGKGAWEGFAYVNPSEVV